MPTTFQQSYDAVARLVDVFEDVMRGRKALEFDEESTRVTLINPFWRALGWNVEDPREVVHEKRVATRRGTKRADYCFNVRGRPAFVVEAKEAGKKLTDPDLVFQAKRYGYNLPVPVAILTDFEEFRPFKSALEPVYENPGRGLIKKFDLRYDQYLDRWEDVYKTFSRDAVYGNSLEKLVGTTVRNKEALDKKFFERLTAWREELARVIALDNGDVGVHDLNEAVQRILDRIIFVRVIEDREIEPVELLQDAVNRWGREKEKPLYQYVTDVFRKLDPQYNGELFASHFSEGLLVRDNPLSDFIESLYYPLCPYQFNVIGVEMLGTIYERFLGSTIRLTPSHRAKVEEKPEVRKAGGVYYTPAYIVDYIVENTVGKLLEKCKTPKDAVKLKILDPACGSGSFLLGAFRRLIEWHEDYYNAHPEKISNPPSGTAAFRRAECWLDKEHPDGPRHRLTARSKGRILVNNIYGVDIDPQAVEVTVMSLYLKVLEDVDAGLLMKTALLPPLDGNVKCGNSLIGSDYWDFVRAEQGELFERTEAEERRVNPFDWDQEFPEVIKYKPGTRDLADGYGFDAVIGNPPWGADVKKNEKPYLRNRYRLNTGKYESYIFFIEKASKLLNSKGIWGFIVPSYWISRSQTDNLREYLYGTLWTTNLIILPEHVFTGVKMDSSIITATRKKRELISLAEVRKTDIDENMTAEELAELCKTIKSAYWDEYPNVRFNPRISSKDINILLKIGKTWFNLVDVVELTQGLTLYRKSTLIKKFGRAKGEDIVKRRLFHAAFKKDDTYKKELLGRDVSRYLVIWNGKSWVSYGPWLAHAVDEKFFQGPRLVIQKLRNPMLKQRLVVGYLDDNETYSAGVLLNAILRKGSKYDLYYIMGILNSKAINYWYRKNVLDVSIRVIDIGRVPIYKIDFSDPADVEKHDLMIRLVDEMLDLHKRLAAAKSDADRTRLERAVKTTDRKIDALVYDLYDLTEEEIRVVESS